MGADAPRQAARAGHLRAIKDEIIALSEEYQIITPYTSLLVLETDADRERFKVKRRFQMRDGEKFFAEGRDNAKYELIQQQMKLAGNWRIGMRNRVLSSMAELDRSAQIFAPNVHGRFGGGGGWGGKPSSGGVNWGMNAFFRETDAKWNADALYDGFSSHDRGSFPVSDSAISLDFDGSGPVGQKSDMFSELGERQNELGQQFDEASAEPSEVFAGMPMSLAAKKSLGDYDREDYYGADFQNMPLGAFGPMPTGGGRGFGWNGELPASAG